MSTRIVKAYGVSALLFAAATSVASASTYYQTTDFQSSNISSSNAATTDFVSDLQLGTAPTDHANTPIVNSNSVTLEGESNQSAVVGLIDSGANNDGVYGDTDAVLDFTPVNVGDVTYTTFGLGERLTGGGPITSKTNNYPAYLVYYDVGTLELTQEQGYTSGYGTSM
ncbi:MAG TPA: hypothetical protein VHY37_13205, partial [Tepidisphaeraceae bacterium]|nr:hypothetical protein [Tepidisphaeraceae bacterium]